MSDIFISYANTDREKAETIAQALESKGWSVWWDRKIPHGTDFSEFIKEKLDNTKCVVALWSTESVESKWVRREATEADDREILVPALIEDVKIPWLFKHIHAARLVDWRPTFPHEEFDHLIASIEAMIGPAKSEEQENQSDNLKAVEQQEISSEIQTGVEQQIPEETFKRESSNIPLIKQILLKIPISMTRQIVTPIDKIKLLNTPKWMFIFAAFGYSYVFVISDLFNKEYLLQAHAPDSVLHAVVYGLIPGVIAGFIIGRPSLLSLLLFAIGNTVVGFFYYFVPEYLPMQEVPMSESSNAVIVTPAETPYWNLVTAWALVSILTAIIARLLQRKLDRVNLYRN